MNKFVLPLAIGALIALWVGPIIEKAMTEAAAILVYNIDSVGKQLTLPACVTEDSNNCFWDATHRGNGKGQSFYTLNDVTYLID